MNPVSGFAPLRLSAFAFRPLSTAAPAPSVRFWARLVLALAVALTGGGLRAGADDAGIVRLEALGEALRRHEAWTAEYRQEYVAAGMSQGDEQKGKVWVAWPLRVLFETSDPEVRSLGLDGRRVRLVDVEAGSCDDHELTDEEWERVPLAALLDPRGAAERFSVSSTGGGGIVLEPRSKGGVNRVDVELDDAHMPLRFVVVDPQGAVNRVTFSGWKPARPPGAWLPDPPSGIICMDTEGE